MTTKQGPQALDSEALEGVTGGTGIRDMLGYSGSTPTGDGPDAPPETVSGGGGSPDGQESNDWILGEDYTPPGPSDLLDPNITPDLAANIPNT
jgi:hypothetical protein